jgi:antitoxin component YwqK of YwqJK toxin-antitoxin module
MKTKTNQLDSDGWHHGPHVYWYSNREGKQPRIKQKVCYVHGLIDGYLKHWHEESGLLSYELNYSNGRLEGEGIEYNYYKKQLKNGK